MKANLHWYFPQAGGRMTDKRWLHQANLTCFSPPNQHMKNRHSISPAGFYDGTHNEGELTHFLFTVEPIKRLE